MEITFDNLPQVVSDLRESINDIKRLLLVKSNVPTVEADELLTVQDAAKFLHLSVPTIYGLIHKGSLPVMKRSKRCYFSKIELLDYIKQGRKKTISEINGEVDIFLSEQKRVGKR